MLDWWITSHHPSDMLGTSIRYCSADLYNTDTMYNPPDIRWHVLNNTMSQYYLHYYRIFGLKALTCRFLCGSHSTCSSSECLINRRIPSNDCRPCLMIC